MNEGKITKFNAHEIFIKLSYPPSLSARSFHLSNILLSNTLQMMKDLSLILLPSCLRIIKGYHSLSWLILRMTHGNFTLILHLIVNNIKKLPLFTKESHKIVPFIIYFMARSGILLTYKKSDKAFTYHAPYAFLSCINNVLFFQEFL